METGQKVSRQGVLEGLRRFLIPWGAVAAGPLLLLGPAVIRGEVLFWGTPMLQFVPWRQFAIDVLRQGFVPLWNPLVGMGAPLLANYQSALLYPLNWLLIPLGVTWGQGLLVILHLVLAGVGMVALGRGLGFQSLSAAISGLAYSLSGYLVARAGFFSINAATAWVPWILLGVERAAHSPAAADRRSVSLLLTAAFLLQWLAGHAQTAWYTLLLALAWWAWRTVSSESWRGLLTQLPALVLPASIAFLLASPQLVPTLEYLANSQRAAALDAELALTYSFWPWRLLELVAPGIFGLPTRGDFWGYGNYWEDAIYLGKLPLLLAIGGAVAVFRNRGRHVGLGRFLLAAIAVSLLLSLGKNTPVFPWLYASVPTFDLFHAPTRWSLLAVVALSLLAGLGAERWAPPAGRGLYWARLGTAGAVAVAGAAGLAALLLEEVRVTFLSATAVAGLWLVVAGGLNLLQRKGRGPLWQIGVVAFLVTDLLLATTGLNPTTSPDLYRGGSQLARLRLAGHRLYLDPETEYQLKFFDFFRFDTFYAIEDWRRVRDWGLPNTPMLEGIASANNFDPLLPGRYERWLEELSQLAPARQRPVLALMDVGQARLTAPTENGPDYERIRGPARARWVSQAQLVASPEQALVETLSSNHDLTQVVILEAPAPAPVAGGEGTIRAVHQLGPNTVEIEVEAEGEGWLLLADVNYPGWRATLDGQPAEILPADYLFRAVRVPAGDHRVRFDYRPGSWYLGLAMFGVGLALLGAVLWRRR